MAAAPSATKNRIASGPVGEQLRAGLARLRFRDQFHDAAERGGLAGAAHPHGQRAAAVHGARDDRRSRPSSPTGADSPVTSGLVDVGLAPSITSPSAGTLRTGSHQHEVARRLSWGEGTQS